MEELFFPVLSHFLNGNGWLSSRGRLRWKITPNQEEGTLRCEVWEGPCCYELSQVEGETQVPLSEEGLAALVPFLEEWESRLSERSVPTLAETIARRDRLIAQRQEPEEE